MTPETLRLVVIVALLAGLGGWLLLTLLFRVTGTWERVLTQEEHDEGALPERVTLGQLGPFITGRRDVPGGHQEYSGIAVGPRLWLTRRDHGQKALVRMGFPEPIAQKLDGEVMAKMKMSLVEGGLFLEGSFEPLKVEFTHQPPRVTAMVPQPPSARRYRRVQPIEDRVPAFDDVEATEA